MMDQKVVPKTELKVVPKIFLHRNVPCRNRDNHNYPYKENMNGDIMYLSCDGCGICPYFENGEHIEFPCGIDSKCMWCDGQ